MRVFLSAGRMEGAAAHGMQPRRRQCSGRQRAGVCDRRARLLRRVHGARHPGHRRVLRPTDRVVDRRGHHSSQPLRGRRSRSLALASPGDSFPGTTVLLSGWLKVSLLHLPKRLPQLWWLHPCMTVTKGVSLGRQKVPLWKPLATCSGELNLKEVTCLPSQLLNHQKARFSQH